MTENKFYKPVGGIVAAELFFAGECRSLDEVLSGECVEVELLDDGSDYEESIRAKERLVSVQHTLTLVAPRSNAEGWLAQEFVARCATEGVVARIELASGEVLVVGFDARFGVEQALRLDELRFLSGRSLNDSPRVALKLSCCDTHSALQ